MRAALVLLALTIAGCTMTEPEVQPATIRVATYNVALNFPTAGGLAEALADPTLERARRVAAVIQRVRPDIILLNEVDQDPEMLGLDRFVAQFLEHGQLGQQPIHYPYRFVAPVNTGVPSGVDLNGDGKIGGPEDAFGYGAFPGQYGMVVLSRLPIDGEQARTFQNFLWQDMPDAWWPMDPDTGDHYYSDAARAVFRLSSKSHWDVPIELPDGRTLHLLASHPTPPVFDGPEDRNGRRNHDEIRFWADYLNGASYMVDDHGTAGGLGGDASFVIAGDLNADPRDGDSSNNPMRLLLDHGRVDATTVPTSAGAVAAADTGVNRSHQGDPAADTGDFSDDEGPGNLRIDYVLPSTDLEIVDAGVFWPAPGQPGAEWVLASDHRLVWIDITIDR